MRMNNWTDGTHNISLVDGSTNYALLYKYGDATNNASIENSYTNGGVSFSKAKGLYSLMLKMTIPESTPASSSGWWTNFWMLFRTE